METHPRTARGAGRGLSSLAVIAFSLGTALTGARAQPDAEPPDAEQPAPEPEAPVELETGASADPKPEPEPLPLPKAEAAPQPTAQAAPESKQPKPTRIEKRAIATTAFGVLGLKGRIFTGLALRHREGQTIVGSDGVPRSNDVDSLDLVLESARFSLLYQAPVRWLSSEIELEVADPDQVELRDVYLLAESGPFSVKAGNFKLPTSALELESTWTLPSPRRGFVNDLLTDYLDVAGRSPGLQLGFRERSGIEPSLSVGVFQGNVLVEHVGDDRDVEPIANASLEAQSFAARGAIELGRVDIAVFFEHRVGSRAPLQTHHAPVVGADIVFDDELGAFGVRLWLDAHYGESWYEHASKPERAGDPWFLALRAIAAVRHGGLSDDTLYVEPFAAGGFFDPDLEVTADAAWELSAGLNVGLWDRARLTLEGFTHRAARNFPEGYFNGASSRVLGLSLLAGVAF